MGLLRTGNKHFIVIATCTACWDVALPLHRSGWICALWLARLWQLSVRYLCPLLRQRSNLPSSSCAQTFLDANTQRRGSSLGVSHSIDWQSRLYRCMLQLQNGPQCIFCPKMQGKEVVCNLLMNCSAETSPVLVSSDKRLKNPATPQNEKHIYKQAFHIALQTLRLYSCANRSTGVQLTNQPRSDSPRLKSAIHSGLRTRPSPGLVGEMGGEKEMALLLQSSSWSRAGSKSGVSSSNIPQSLLSENTKSEVHKHTPERVCGIKCSVAHEPPHHCNVLTWQ